SMAYGPHGDGSALAEIMHQTYFADIKGLNPMHTEYIWQKLVRKNRHMYNETDALLGVFDVAMWDIKGKVLNTSVSELLGGFRKKVKTYATGHIYLPTEEEIFDEAKAVKEAGYHAYKLQLWQGLE